MPVPTLTVTVYRSRYTNPSQQWRWHAKTANGRKVASSGEGYTNKADCEDMARRIVEGRFLLNWKIQGEKS